MTQISSPALSVVASEIRQGQRFDAGVLRTIVRQNLVSQVQSCNANSLRDILLLQLSLADASYQSRDFQMADTDLADVKTIATALLTCAPREGLGWFAQYWVAIRQIGFGPRPLSYLSQSYRFAPHEAWIQLLRAPLALRSFDLLPKPLQDDALSDFKDILAADLVTSAAISAQMASATGRIKLLDAACSFSEEKRKVFLHYLIEENFEVTHRCFQRDDKPAYMH